MQPITARALAAAAALASFFFGNNTIAAQSANPEFLNVMTFNVRYANSADGLNAWHYRKDWASGQILFHEAHIVGVQEAVEEQMNDLQMRLPRYRWVGAGRDDGKRKGEFNAIFYDTTRLVVVRSGVFWLSETPDAPGRIGWDAALPRIAAWAVLRDKTTERLFTVVNTHFDHAGKQARRESAKLLLRKLPELRAQPPYVVMGDLNSFPHEEAAALLAAALPDTKTTSRSGHYGPSGTFNGFQHNEQEDRPIDYIFASAEVETLQHATLSQTWRGRFSSDHFPVFARIRLR